MERFMDTNYNKVFNFKASVFHNALFQGFLSLRYSMKPSVNSFISQITP